MKRYLGIFAFLAIAACSALISVVKADPQDAIGSGSISMASTSNFLQFTPTTGLNSAKSTLRFSTGGLGASGGAITVYTSQDCVTFPAGNQALITNDATGAQGTTETADAEYSVNAAARQCMRIQVSTTGSGTVTINFMITAGISATGSGGSGGSVTQGTNPWIVSCGGTPCAVSTPQPLPSASAAPNPPYVAICFAANNCVIPLNGAWPIFNAPQTGFGLSLESPSPQTNASPLPFVTGATPMTVYGIATSWTASVSTAVGCFLNYWDSATIPNPASTPTGTWGFVTSAAIGGYAAPISPTNGIKITNGLWLGAYTSPFGGVACNTAANALLLGPVLRK